MSGDHNRYQKPDYIDRRQWKYDPMTGEPLTRREWQGLTDEEIRKTVEGYFEFDGGDMWGSYRAIEAALKSKNG